MAIAKAALPVGSNHALVSVTTVLGLGSYNHTVGYPKKMYVMSLEVFAYFDLQLAVDLEALADPGRLASPEVKP